MSVTFYLRCIETKNTVHAAEQSSSGFTGGVEPKVLTAFLLAHQGKQLDVVEAGHFDDFMEFEEWTSDNCGAAYAALMGYPLPGL